MLSSLYSLFLHPRTWGYVLPLMACAHAVNANTALDKLEDDFDKHWQSHNAAFEQHVQHQNTDFEAALQAQWQTFQAFGEEQAFTHPKPRTAPIAPQQRKKPATQPQSVTITQLPNATRPASPSPSSPRQAPQGDQTSVQLYGQTFKLPTIPTFGLTGRRYRTIDDIRRFHQDFATIAKRHSTAIEALRGSEHDYLSDWLTFALVRAYTTTSVISQNDSYLMTWALMNELGFDVRLGLSNDGNIELLYPTQQKVYGAGYFKLNGQRYYRFSRSQTPLQTYAGNVNKKALDLSFSNSDFAMFSHTFADWHTLRDSDTGLTVRLKRSRALNRYFLERPGLDFEHYFRAPLEVNTEKTIISALRRATKGMNQFEAAQYVLTFVQLSFAYQLDKDKWGKEYYAPPQHTLSLDSADCEDRVFLLAYLLKRLLNIDSMGLHYPGHLSLAIAVDKAPNNITSMTITGKTYYAADPTYIGASIGMTQPNYVGSRPKIVDY